MWTLQPIAYIQTPALLHPSCGNLGKLDNLRLSFHIQGNGANNTATCIQSQCYCKGSIVHTLEFTVPGAKVCVAISYHDYLCGTQVHMGLHFYR